MLNGRKGFTIPTFFQVYIKLRKKKKKVRDHVV